MTYDFDVSISESNGRDVILHHIAFVRFDLCTGEYVFIGNDGTVIRLAQERIKSISWGKDEEVVDE